MTNTAAKPRSDRFRSTARARHAGALALAAAACLAAAGQSACERSAPAATSSSEASRAADDDRPRAARAAHAVPIEMFSWWTRAGEVDSLGTLLGFHGRVHPGDIIINATAELSGLARKTLRTRMMHGEPPDTFQANAGNDLMQWVRMNGTDATESRLVALDTVLPAEVAAWRRVMPQVLLDQVSHDGKMYAVPANVHRINTIFYNKHVFDLHGLEEPRSVADLVTLARRLEGTNVPLFGLGGREPWTIALFVFECLLVSREGPHFYNEYFHGRLKADDPRMIGTLQEAVKLLGFVNADYQQLSWLEAVDLVANGRAAITVIGDWARSSLNARGLKIGQDYGQLPFPGSEATFVFTSDTFNLPVGAKNRAGALRLLATIGSAEAQREVDTTKGTLAARTDVLPPADDPTLTEMHTLLRHGPLVLALSGMVPREFSEDVAAALLEMLREHDIDPVVHALRSRYALLK
jgi:glucose/mannose transport system substrate-binding protein